MSAGGRGLGLRSRLLLLTLLGSSPALPLGAAWAGWVGRGAGLLLAVALLAGSLGLAWFAIDRLLAPLHALQQAMRKVSEEGDLTVQAPLGHAAETGELIGYFNALVEHLRQVYVSLGQSVALLEQNVGALRDNLEAQEQGTARQAANLQQTQVTAEEIRQSAGTADLRAQEVLRATREAAQLGEQGLVALARGRSSLDAIAAQVADMRERVGSLPGRIRGIEDLLDTVKDLADQSNMLALNAAIEATRAGEHGKGFALVAREIRSLADQSIRSTQRIRETLDATRQAVAETDRLAGEGAVKVRESLGVMADTSARLEQVAGLVRSDAESAAQIAEAVRQQAVGVEQIFGALRDQTAMMLDNRGQAERASAAIQPLQALSARMGKLVRRFQVG